MMARCYQLTPADSARWNHGDAWDSLQIEDAVMAWAERNHIRQPVIVVTDQKKIAFALTYKGLRA